MNHAHVRRLRSAAFGGSLILVSVTTYGQPAPALQMRALAATCANCHGTDGNAIQGEAMARLAGLPKEYIVAQMLAFREGRRPATVMHQISKGYTPEQIESLAIYFAAKK